MPWVIGIDEAGYGPNLGPLVMTSVACKVPRELIGTCLWRVLRGAVRRHGDANDGRVLVADSKVVYSSARGLLGLETGVLTALPLDGVNEPPSLAQYLKRLAPSAPSELAGERWYSGTSLLPVTATPGDCRTAAERFTAACHAAGVAWGLVRSVVVCPQRFNEILDRWGSKGAVLGHSLTELIRYNRESAGRAPLHFFVDKHGGRNTYAPMLQEAFPDGMVIAHEERAARSAYTVAGSAQEVRLTFQPRADAEHFCVALASMISKYLREVLMLEFNRFWQAQVPGLKPTAGYPADAGRFFAAIRPALRRLGLQETALWRWK
jgi:hypothetical protein